MTKWRMALVDYLLNSPLNQVTKATKEKEQTFFGGGGTVIYLIRRGDAPMAVALCFLRNFASPLRQKRVHVREDAGYNAEVGHPLKSFRGIGTISRDDHKWRPLSHLWSMGLPG